MGAHATRAKEYYFGARRTPLELEFQFERHFSNLDKSSHIFVRTLVAARALAHHVLAGRRGRGGTGTPSPICYCQSYTLAVRVQLQIHDLQIMEAD